MASNKEYLEYILGQLSELEEITYRTMMGEFILYYRGKIVGGIYDDRLLVKPVKSAVWYMSTASNRMTSSIFLLWGLKYSKCRNVNVHCL